MTLQQLRYFQVLAKVQHYTKASSTLFISQPSLSYAMAELEKELKIRLFDKQGKKTALSEQGRIFLKYVDGSLSLLDEGIDALRLQSPLRGKVTLGYISSLGYTFIPELLTGFYKDEANAKIIFNFVQNLNSFLIEALKAGTIDLAFCPTPPGDLHCIPVLQQELFLAVPRSHRLAGRQTVDILEVKDEPFVFTNRKSGLRRTIGQIFREMGIRPRIAFEAEDCNVAITFVSLSYGLSIIPAMPIVGHPDVVALKLRNPEFTRTVYLAWLPSRDLSPAAQRLKDYMAERFQIVSSPGTPGEAVT